LDELRLHQYMNGQFAATLADGPVSIDVTTDYPWDGQITVTVEQTVPAEWTLTLRLPHWAQTYTVTVNGQPGDVTEDRGWLRIGRRWQTGEKVMFDIPLSPRFTRGDPRVDADRGQVAVERGPLVYCIEAADHPGKRLDDITVDPTGPSSIGDPMPDLGGVTPLYLAGRQRVRMSAASWWPYTDNSTDEEHTTTAISLTAIPYYLWGNRQSGAMRVWLPRVAPEASRY
jgi:DUF1680 family protein